MLFACYTLLRHQPHVIVCLRSMIQETQRSAKVTYQEREAETEQAMNLLGIEWTQLPVPDIDPVWEDVETYLNAWATADPYADHFGTLRVWAPAWEEGGHEQHNVIANLADSIFGPENVTHYLTYRRGSERSRSEHEVAYEPEWLALKMQAVACYRSQMREPSTRPWFAELLDWREWYAESA